MIGGCSGPANCHSCAIAASIEAIGFCPRAAPTARQSAALGFGRDAMNRIQNHREGGIGSVYDRHSCADGNRRIKAAGAQHLLSLAEAGAADSNVILIGPRATQHNRRGQ